MFFFFFLHTIYALFPRLLETQRFCVEKQIMIKLFFCYNFPSYFAVSIERFRATNGHFTTKNGIGLYLNLQPISNFALQPGNIGSIIL